jgi:hypothetical protein
MRCCGVTFARRLVTHQNSANDLNSGATPSKFESFGPRLQLAPDGLNKESRKKIISNLCSCFPAFLIQILSFENWRN